MKLNDQKLVVIESNNPNQSTTLRDIPSLEECILLVRSRRVRRKPQIFPRLHSTVTTLLVPRTSATTSPAAGRAFTLTAGSCAFAEVHGAGGGLLSKHNESFLVQSSLNMAKGAV